MIIKGTAHKYGENIDTDAIIPARYLNLSDADELARHCMEGLDSKFISKIKKGDIIVAKTNFGCGSSREHAPLAIKAAGISAVIAASFARIFFRNAINIGLPVIESPEAAEIVDDGSEVEIDVEKGLIKNKGKSIRAQTYPEFVLRIINAGGLMNLTKELIKA